MNNTINPLLKIAKKLNLTEEFARDIIVCEHELKHLYNKKDLKKINLNFDKNAENMLKRIAKALKVSVSAVVTVALAEALNKEVNQNMRR